ncbi:hypothetical protein JSQ81_14235 [Sporosarcina sp. Marseille-Q4063]|uniref:hypothetical protein n=1 Tax=Sporosarcina sp. Marseille-Q4063 TaxID=2810514 RepID=UPI001BB0AE9D|nr:hypothetical protein [Sporosarcina sp. Marseille-Q4063]QUW20967.1 hypothetical protein JSQ81_14235 [Sporosarcina sp. Marseille-Q4063]
MTSIPADALKHFNNAIYLPMLITILEKDMLTIEETQLKFKRPYTKMIEQALKSVRADLKKTNIYLLRNNMQLIKRNSNKEFTEFILSSGAYEKFEKYSSEDLKNRTEEKIGEYFAKFVI